ncbi:repressor LexA [Candidatus Poribacteria bacterium]|nr:repressor LexA [Candidatus Poribacteria bacterium]
MKSLTEKQDRVLQFIINFVRDNSVPPTVREIMRGLGFSSPRPVQDHLKILQRKGYLTIKNKVSRGIELSPHLIEIPVLGRVGAGKVIAEQDIEGYIDVGKILTTSKDLFGLRVKGSSMAGAGIHDQDIVVVCRQPFADPGDLVVVVRNGEAFIRWLRKNDNGLYLQANALEGEYPNEELTDDLNMMGKVVFMLRNYSYQLVNPSRIG